eukprot:2284176-Pleurochrysis_carterae.AAC.1
MAPWARGVVWDCADPARCVPVQRSTRHTQFEGARQLDRAALRAAASTLNWADAGIVEQVGEGGVEVRPGCELITVLAFQHPGLVEQAPAAARAVEADTRERWVSPPTRHLPYAPCRLQPRDVIMQVRQCVMRGAEGEMRVEDYAKPRVTTNSSYAGKDGLNAGVPDAERVIALPRVQALARALVIIGMCGLEVRVGEGKLRAVPYVVDAESAYRFCPVQQADLWTQCSAWWTRKGRQE